MRPLMVLTLCPVLFLLSCVTLPSPIHTPDSLCLCSLLELNGIYLSQAWTVQLAQTEQGKQSGSKELKEGASAFLHHSGTPVTNQPPSPRPHWSLCCKWIKWDQTVCVSWCLGGQGQAITCSHKPWLALLHAALYTCAVTTMTQNHLSSVFLFIYFGTL